MQEFKFVPYFRHGYLYYEIYTKKWWGWSKVTCVSANELEATKEKLKKFKPYEEKI